MGVQRAYRLRGRSSFGIDGGSRLQQRFLWNRKWIAANTNNHRKGTGYRAGAERYPGVRASNDKGGGGNDRRFPRRRGRGHSLDGEFRFGVGGPASRDASDLVSIAARRHSNPHAVSPPIGIQWQFIGHLAPRISARSAGFAVDRGKPADFSELL